MTAVWGSGPDGQWHTLAPATYQAEAQLHDLVERTPQMLPLAGSPRLTVLSREARLGTGYADLLAVESTGRLVIIEVKLAGNAESRRGGGGAGLGTGSADLLAVESTGRLVIIEVKLAGNAESRRAVVAQVLSYAGYLQGLDVEQLESQVLGASVLPPCRPATRNTRWTPRTSGTGWPAASPRAVSGSSSCWTRRPMN